MKLADNLVPNSVIALLSILGSAVEEETVEGLQRKSEEVLQDKHECKTKVLNLKGDILEKTTVMEAMNLRLERLEEQVRRLDMENESLHVTKEEIVSLPMNPLRPKRPAKSTKKLSEDVEVQCLCISIHWESFLSAWCVKAVEELQQFCCQPISNYFLRWTLLLVDGGKMVSPQPPPMVASCGWFYTRSVSTDEINIHSIMEEEPKGDAC